MGGSMIARNRFCGARVGLMMGNSWKHRRVATAFAFTIAWIFAVEHDAHNGRPRPIQPLA